MKCEQNAVIFEHVELGHLNRSFLISMGNAMKDGERKHGRKDYLGHPSSDKTWDKVFRHINAFRGGQNIDMDSGEPHLARAAANLQVIQEQLECKVGEAPIE